MDYCGAVISILYVWKSDIQNSQSGIIRHINTPYDVMGVLLKVVISSLHYVMAFQLLKYSHFHSRGYNVNMRKYFYDWLIA